MRKAAIRFDDILGAAAAVYGEQEGASEALAREAVTLRDGRVVYSKGNDYIIDAVRCALLIREEESLDLGGEEVVSLKPVLTDPVFI